MKWFRWYRGTAERAKFRVIARRASKPGPGGGSVHEDRIDGAVFATDVLAVWVTLLEDAGNASHWGYVTRDSYYIATLLDLGAEEVDCIIFGMIEEQMIENCGKGDKGNLYHIVNWEKYQFVSDTDPTSHERQKRYREKRKSNALVTRTDTDTDTDTDTEKKKEYIGRSQATRPTPNEEKFEEFWKAYPKRKGANPKAPARKAFFAFVKAGIDPGLITAGVRRCAEADRDKIGTEYIPQSIKWLRDRRWEDYAVIAGPNDRPSWKDPPWVREGISQEVWKERELAKVNGAGVR